MIKLYTTTEVAQRANLPNDTAVRRLIYNGKIQAVTITPTNGVRETYGITEQALNNFLKNRK